MTLRQTRVWSALDRGAPGRTAPRSDAAPPGDAAQLLLGRPQSPDPFLTAWEAVELGRGVNDAPDAWCYLRESYVHEHNDGNGKVVPVKNFERWLYQRDAPGYETHPVHKVEFLNRPSTLSRMSMSRATTTIMWRGRGNASGSR